MLPTVTADTAHSIPTACSPPACCAALALTERLRQNRRVACLLALRLVRSQYSLCCRCSTVGAFVAGNRAGYAYPTWPLMEDQFVPDAERLFELQVSTP